MNKTLIAATLILLISLSLVLAATKTGKFQIGNEPPVVSNLRVQDGPNANDLDPSGIAYDGTAERDTHDITPRFVWDLTDPNPDSITTRICISDELAYQADPCSDITPILDYTTLANEYQYTLASALPWPSCGASNTYYISLTPNDGAINGISLVTNFIIINSVPNIPSALLMNPEILPATTPRSTHSQTPIFSWSYSDPDSGGINKWPADTLTHSAYIGVSCGGNEYLNIPAGTANPAGQQSNIIPWGPIVGTQSTTPFCVRLITIDEALCASTPLDTNFKLIDNIPNPAPSVTGVKFSEDLLDMRTCYAAGQPSPCYIFLSEGQYQTANLRVEFTELDKDCSSDNVQVVLKYPSQGANYPAKDFTYNLNYFSGDGSSTCVFTGTFSSIDGIEFFRQTPVTDYNMEVTITSQAGSLSPGVFGWDIVELPYIKIADTYTDIEDGIIDLGDPLTCTSGETTAGNGINLNLWNPGLCLEKITNWGNKLLTLKWEATDPRNVPTYTCTATAPDCCLGSSTSGCWDLTTDTNRFWLDDDNDVTLESAPLTPIDLPEEGSIPATFNPAGGLQVCNAITCSDAILDETLDTYYHIQPPLGLSPGDYETTITIGLV